MRNETAQYEVQQELDLMEDRKKRVEVYIQLFLLNAYYFTQQPL